ncbi:unnamed protein product [Calypogeia fissa]
MVDDDDDYMADLSKFLPTESSVPVVQVNGKLSVDAKSKPPGKEKRKVVVQEQKKKTEDEHRKEGLGSAIPSSNIGFKMLQQMGYNPGTALGKHGQGLLEPVNIDLKRSKKGLGRDVADKEEQLVKAKKAEVEAMRNRQKEKALRADFQGRRRDSWHSRKIKSDYRKACATLLQLEERSQSSVSAEQVGKDNILTSQKPAIVNDRVSTSGETEDKAEEEEEEEITLEMLQEMLQKLRDEYHYCLYCGYKYESAPALTANCPGLEEDAH